jgi:hypothetical protein
LGADEAGGDDLRVIEDEKVFWGEDGGEVANGKIGEFSGRAAEEEESGGVPGVGGGSGDSIVGDSEKEEFFQKGVSHGQLTECAKWGMFHL